MGRPKEFPEKIYVSMDSRRNLILLDFPEKVIEKLRLLGQQVQLYCVPEPFRKPHKARQPAQTPTVIRKTCLDGTASTPIEPDKQPETKPEALPTALEIVPVIGTNLDRKGEPIKPEHHFACKVFKLHHRRTKKELDSMPGADELQDKPKWKCVCGWEGDNPVKLMRGINKGKYACPKCYSVVFKNE